MNRSFPSIPPLRHLCALALAALACAGGPTAALAGPVALDSSGRLGTFAQADVADFRITDANSVRPADPLTDFRIDSSAYSVSHDGSEEAMARINLESLWGGAAQGTVAWSVNYAARNPWIGGLGLDGVNQWTYRFRTDEASVLRLSFDVDPDPLVGSHGAMGGFWFIVDGAVVSQLPVGSHGTLEFGLAADEVYEIALRVPGNYYEHLTRDVQEGMGGLFQWSIEDRDVPGSSVPEPSGPLLLAVAGLAAWGGRRRPTCPSRPSAR